MTCEVCGEEVPDQLAALRVCGRCHKLAPSERVALAAELLLARVAAAERG